MTTRNVGDFDRAIRVLIGLAVLTFVKGWLAAWALFPLLTGVMGICPLYRIFGLSTRVAPRTTIVRPAPFSAPVRIVSTRDAPAWRTSMNVQDSRLRHQPPRSR